MTRIECHVMHAQIATQLGVSGFALKLLGIVVLNDDMSTMPVARSSTFDCSTTDCKDHTNRLRHVIIGKSNKRNKRN